MPHVQNFKKMPSTIESTDLKMKMAKPKQVIQENPS